MGRIVFLLGGSGNIFFQIVNIEKKKFYYSVSDLFLHASVRRLLNHTNHRDIHRELFKIKAQSPLINVFFPVLLFDIFLSKIFGYCLFSNLDLGFCKGKPILYDLIYFGYFQNNASLTDIRNSKEKVIDYKDNNYDLNKVVIHIRGGDFLENKCALGYEYYKSAVRIAIDRSEEKLEFIVVTDDTRWSKKIMDKVVDVDKYVLINKDEIFDFGYLNSCKTVITSNSTFALIAVLTNKSINSAIIPIDVYKKFKGKGAVIDMEIIAI
jgi:hypothetical protein